MYWRKTRAAPTMLSSTVSPRILVVVIIAVMVSPWGLVRSQRRPKPGRGELESKNKDRVCSSADYKATCNMACGTGTCYEETGLANSYCLCEKRRPTVSGSAGLTGCTYRKKMALRESASMMNGTQMIQKCFDKCDDMDLRPKYCRRAMPIDNSNLVCVCVM